MFWRRSSEDESELEPTADARGELAPVRIFTVYTTIEGWVDVAGQRLSDVNVRSAQRLQLECWSRARPATHNCRRGRRRLGHLSLRLKLHRLCSPAAGATPRT